ncbi:hypothetical protein [Arthrobacter sp. SO5]|uniref:hypothetical protein n=1 Tax=Arthrobacter sp. SO5 TaxID=1897055 RepID=UPI001E404C85|nr:hypothetical protein [Arthrobacter sp. SO5]
MDDGFGCRISDLWEYPLEAVPLERSKEIWEEFPRQTAATDFNAPEWERVNVWHVHSNAALILPPGADSWQQRLCGLKLQPTLASSVEQWRKKLPVSYVGVQIRAHAELTHQKTLDASPVDWFLERMETIQEAAPDTSFFVSCDVEATQERIFAEIPNCFGLTAKGEYNSAAALRSSIVDLYLLSGSSYLMGPYWSSFVELAWELARRRIPLETSKRYTAAGR